MPDAYGPTLHQRLLEPLSSLHQMGRRSVLALLGIAMGCAAVVALLNIGDNAAAQAMGVFKGMGSDLLIVNVDSMPTGKASPVPATLDAQALHNAIPGLQDIATTVLAAAELRVPGHAQSVMVLGSDAALQGALGLKLARGRFLSAYDGRSTYAVLGATLAGQLQAEGAAVEPGSQVQLGGYVYEVVGVLAQQDDNPLLPFPINDALLLPVEGMGRLVPVPQIASVIARVQPGGEPETAGDLLKRWLEGWAPGHEMALQIPRQLLAGMARQAHTFSWLLGAVAAIALLMGGVGVMNVMLMNVSERRREIGVRIALGARARDIGGLFLAEALVLAVTGAVLGAVVGVVTAWGFARASGWAFELSASALPLGMGSSLLVGLFFGLQPALSAARLAPVQALRDD